MSDSLYSWWETAVCQTVVCTTVCTGGGNICMYDSVQVVETVVCLTVCTGGGNSCMYDSLYRWGEQLLYV